MRDVKDTMVPTNFLLESEDQKKMEKEIPAPLCEPVASSVRLGHHPQDHPQNLPYALDCLDHALILSVMTVSLAGEDMTVQSL